MSTSTAQSLLIRNAHILTMDPALGDISGGDLLVEGGRIAAVARHLDAPAGAEEIDATGCIVIPGFVDTHRHMWQAILRGRTPHDTLRDYFQNVLMDLGPALTAEDLHLANLLGARAALASGVTTVQDISNIQATPEHSDALVEGLKESGLRAVFAYGIDVPQALAKGSRLPEDVRRVRAELLPDDDALVTFAILTELGDDEAELHNARLARDLAVRTARHVVPRPGEPHLSRLKKLDVLLPGTTFIHGTQLPVDELRLIADGGSSLSIAPAIEMMMGHGYPPFARAAEAGLRISLSTDVEVTASADMFTQMRAAYQAGRLSQLTSEESADRRLTVQDILRCATLAGAETLGLDDRIGSLTPGKQADLLVLRADQPDTAPVHDPCSTVVLQMDRAHIDTVLVAGKPVRRGGRSLVDNSDLVAKSQELVDRLGTKGQSTTTGPAGAVPFSE
ncbi:amidohydrolase family protein [Streptomyces sp. NPDC058464]|uniref:amidohydrolase family protein n=1 Tax=Streptomyces sp. NPDC058464 TaxID=3346511 RepID=UPI00365C169B